MDTLSNELKKKKTIPLYISISEILLDFNLILPKLCMHDVFVEFEYVYFSEW
jgi:hypothetical protein